MDWPLTTRVGGPPPTWNVIPITVERPVSLRVTTSCPVEAPTGTRPLIATGVQTTLSSGTPPSVTTPLSPKPKSLGTPATLTP